MQSIDHVVLGSNILGSLRILQVSRPLLILGQSTQTEQFRVLPETLQH